MLPSGRGVDSRAVSSVCGLPIKAGAAYSSVKQTRRQVKKGNKGLQDSTVRRESGTLKQFCLDAKISCI